MMSLAAALCFGLFGGCAQNQVSEYQSTYHYPQVSSGALFLTLPPEVQNTIRAQTGGEQIDDIRKFTNSGAVYYRIEFRKSVLYPPLFVATNGAVLNPDQSVAVREPSATLKEIKGDAPAPTSP